MSPNFSSIDMINSSSISNNTTGSKIKVIVKAMLKIIREDQFRLMMG